MHSHNYVPGVSGWKLYENGNLEIDGLIRSGPAKGEAVKAEPKPFIVVDGVTYISEAEVERGSITKAKLDAMWSVKTELRNGNYVCVGVGVGISSNGFNKPDIIVSAESIEILPDGTVKIKQRQD